MFGDRVCHFQLSAQHLIVLLTHFQFVLKLAVFVLTVINLGLFFFLLLLQCIFKVVITITIVEQNDSFTLQVLDHNHHNLLFSLLLLQLHFQAAAFILYSGESHALVFALIVDLSHLTPLFPSKPFLHPLSLPHSIES